MEENIKIALVIVVLVAAGAYTIGFVGGINYLERKIGSAAEEALRKYKELREKDER